MKYNYLKLILSMIVCMCTFFTAQHALAMEITLVPSHDTVGIKEQFYVDILINPEGVPVNGIEGKIQFPSNELSFIRAEDGKSMVDLWVEKPDLNGTTIAFAGIMSSGFDGVIDPFNMSHKLPGLILRLVFEAKKQGAADVSLNDVSVTYADGKGTIKNLENKNAHITIQNISNPFIYTNSTVSVPQLNAEVIQDPNLFENKYTLVFQAKDKESGIKEVIVREGNREWKKVSSPYLLEDQTRHSIITVQAVNFAGIASTVTIPPLSNPWMSLSTIVLSIIGLVIIIYILKKKHAHKK